MLDLGGRSVVDVVMVFLGLLLDPNVGDFSSMRFGVRAPITILGELGVSENAVRMALARQVHRGVLEQARSGGTLVYALTDLGLEIIRQGGARIRSVDPFASTFTVWTLASFSVPERRRDLRNRLRIHLHRCGFRPLRDGLWVAFNSFAAELATQDLDAELIDNCELDVFVATPYRGAGLSEMARSGWDVEDMRARHERFLARWEHHDGTVSRALPLLTLFVADWIDLLQHDPGLPREVVGPDWPARRSITTASRMFATLQTPAGVALGDWCESIDPKPAPSSSLSQH